MTRHSLVSCSPTRRATALTGIAETRLMTNASNSKVKPLSGRAQGTLSVLIPQRVQCTRGTRAYRNAWCWKKSRCRQLICSVSYAGQSAAPQQGQAKRLPAATSLRMTAHGGTNPNASCSRLVSRMVISSALAPARLSLAPCSPPSRTLRAASRWPAAILDRSCAQRLRELRPGRRNGSQPNRETPDQPRDWLSLPTPNSEEAINWRPVRSCRTLQPIVDHYHCAERHLAEQCPFRDPRPEWAIWWLLQHTERHHADGAEFDAEC